MKRIIILPFIAFLFFSAGLIGQNSYTIEGHVLSSADESPLAYVNIFFAKGTKGTVSNEEGAFVISIESWDQIDSLFFSHLGYHNKNIVVASSVSDRSLKVLLDPYEYDLPEITVRDIDARQLVVNSLGNISKYFHVQDHLLTGFYREAITYRAQDEALYFAEGVLKTYKKGYENYPSDEYQNLWHKSNSHVAIDSGYVVEDKQTFNYRGQEYNFLDIVGGPTASLAVDLYKESAMLLNVEYLKNYEFEKSGYVRKGDEDFYIIDFYPKSAKKTFFQGQLYYNIEKKVITQAEYHYNYFGIATYNRYSEFNLASRKFYVTYAPLAGKYTIAFVKVENEFYHPSLGHKFDNSIEYSTNEIQLDKVKKIKRKHRFTKNINLRDGLLKRGLTDWSNVTHIPRLEGTSERLERIAQVEEVPQVIKDDRLNEYSFRKAVRLSRETGRLILLIGSADWCAPCKKLKQDIYNTPEVINYLNDNFLPVFVDIEKGGGIALGKKYDIYSLPALRFIEPNGDLFMGFEGYGYIGRFHEQLTEVHFAYDKWNEVLLEQEGTKVNEEEYVEIDTRGTATLEYDDFADPDFFKTLPHSSKFDFILSTSVLHKPPHFLEYFLSHKSSVINSKGLKYFYDKLVHIPIMASKLELMRPETFESIAEVLLGDEATPVTWLYSSDYLRFTKEDPEEAAKAGLNFLVIQQHADLTAFNDMIIYTAKNLQESSDLQLMYSLITRQPESRDMKDHKRFLQYRLTGKMVDPLLRTDEMSERSYYDVLNLSRD